jgi:hypothetical protein
VLDGAAEESLGVIVDVVVEPGEYCTGLVSGRVEMAAEDVRKVVDGDTRSLARILRSNLIGARIVSTY